MKQPETNIATAALPPMPQALKARLLAKLC